MGNCIKRQQTSVQNKRRRAVMHDETDDPCNGVLGLNTSSSSSRGALPTTSFPLMHHLLSDSRRLALPSNCHPTENEIDAHILKTLQILRNSAENDRDLIIQMGSFRSWANSETGWKMVLNSFIRVVPIDEPLGPSAITLFIDHCPLPTKNAVLSFINELTLPTNGESGLNNSTKHRNICAVLGHLAESLSASFSKLILTDEILDYLLGVLVAEKCVRDITATNILFSLVALEKLALTNENKGKILESDVKERLQSLESFNASTECKQRQVGFLAQWLLDNIFIVKGRPYTYETIDVQNVNVMLNDKDVSEYLKISPDGLEARSDAPSFESVRCTFSVDEGIWFYEVTVITSGVMQIGWATKSSKFLNHDGFGIGDDEFSYAYDGCRRLCWHHARSEGHSHPTWKQGDTLGLLLDIEHREVIFYLNGDPLPPDKSLFYCTQGGYFAAGSFMSFQQCLFNFGSKPFKFPPGDKKFSTFNEVAVLGDNDKIILPRPKKLEAYKRVSIREDGCTICYGTRADTVLEPCGHSGICQDCAIQLMQCHLCRNPISGRKII